MSMPKETRTYPFEKLEIWQLSVELVDKIYKISDEFPEDEKFGLISQLRRAAISVSLNIAEGRASDSDPEFRRFLGISLRSLVEIIACIKLCEKLKIVNQITVSYICESCDKIEAKIRKLRNTLGKRRPTQDNPGVMRKASSVKR